jgi:ABC-type glycerol-3-phosphate transport system permease component
MTVNETLPLAVDREARALTSRPPRKRGKRPAGPVTTGFVITRTVTYVIMAVMVVLTVYPLIWMAMGGFKSGSEFYQNIWGIPATLDFANFGYAWTEANLAQKFLNSILVTVGTMVLTLPITSMAGYALAKIRFRGRGIAYIVILLGIMVPYGVIAIPVFTVIVDLHLLNTLLGLVLVYTANAIPLGVFLMYSFFESIPDELEEAAMIDGATRFGAFRRVVLPLAAPGLLAAALYAFTQAWNEFLYALVFITDVRLRTLPVGLSTFITGDVYGWGYLMAGAVLTTLPVIAAYVYLQRYMVEGLTAGSVKG